MAADPEASQDTPGAPEGTPTPPTDEAAPGNEPVAEDSSAATEPSDDSAPATELLSKMASDFGVDLRKKYQSDDALLRGAANAFRALSQRDEDAAFGRALRGHEQEVVEYLRNKQAPPPQQPAKQEEPFSYEQYQLLQAKVIDPATGAARPDARSEDVTKLKQVHDAITRAAFDVSFRRKEAIQDVVKEALTEARTSWEREWAQQAAMQSDTQKVAAFEDQHRSWIYSTDGQLSPQGERLVNYAHEAQQEFASEMGIQLPQSKAFAMAHQRILAEQASAGNSKTVNPAAKRKPGVAPRSAAVDLQKLVDTMSLSEFQEYVVQHPEVLQSQ